MKKQVFCVHGGDSFNTKEDFQQYLRTVTVRDLPGSEGSTFWTKTLAEDLGEQYEVFRPTMPNRQNADYKEWKIWLEKHYEYLRDGVILVGWSLGGMFLAKYLSENKPPFKVARVYLLAAPGGEYPLQADGNDCRTFRFTKEGVQNITENASHLEIWHSEDDFIVPVEEAHWYQKHLTEAKLRLFKDKNHFLLPELPELIEAIKQN